MIILRNIMNVSIRSLQKGILFDGEAISVNAKTTVGEITVLDHHRPLISILQKGNIVVSDGAGKKNNFATMSGFLEMNDANMLTALID